MKHEKGLSAHQICSIIKECHYHDVSKFKFGGLEIDFGSSLCNCTENAEALNNIEEMDVSIIQKTEQADLLRDEVDRRETDLSQLVIDDPVELERQIAKGELVEEGKTTNG